MQVSMASALCRWSLSLVVSCNAGTTPEFPNPFAAKAPDLFMTTVVTCHSPLTLGPGRHHLLGSGPINFLQS
jgi:hypothetical protein